MNDGSAIGGASATLRVALFGGDSDRATPGLVEIASRGVPGSALDVIHDEERVRSCPAGRHDLVHITGGPSERTADAVAYARRAGIPVIVDYDPAHSPALLQSSDLILSPSRAAGAALLMLGIAPTRTLRWRPGIDVGVFHPARYAPDAIPAPANPEHTFHVLHVATAEGGLDLLAEAFQIARDRDPRLRLVLVDDGPADRRRRARDHARASEILLSGLDQDHLASVYASADLLVIPSATDLFGDAVVRAHASGLPVLAVDAGAPAELIENGRTGCLAPPDPAALAAAIRGLARRATLLERLATGGLRATRERTWEASLSRLADAYALAIRPAHDPAVSEVARAA